MVAEALGIYSSSSVFLSLVLASSSDDIAGVDVGAIVSVGVDFGANGCNFATATAAGITS
jgi:hypothetical protein